MERTKPEPLYYRLYRRLVCDIQQGVYKENEKLPSKRVCADDLGISQNTVDAAYQMLATEGYVRVLPRSGFYVNAWQPPIAATPTQPISMAAQKLPEQQTCRFQLTPDAVDVDTFPYATWAKLSKEIMYAQPELAHLGHRQGDLCLRQAICDYLHKYRGVTCAAEQVIVGAGMEYLIMLLHVLFDFDSVLAMENPGYPKVQQIMRNCGRTVLPIPVTDAGISVEALHKTNAALVYITPAHQFPTGVVMPVGRRMELLHWANARPKRFIIEDDYDSKLTYAGKPIPALQGLDSNGKVVYIGTFSRSIAPSVRIAYLVLPPALLQRYHDRCAQYSPTVSRFEQHTLFAFMQRGHFERCLNRKRTAYRKRRDTLVSALRHNQLHISGANAGLHCLLHVQSKLPEHTLVERALQAGVRLNGIGAYNWAEWENLPQTVVLGFARHTPPELQEAADCLLKAWNLKKSEAV